MLNAIQYELIFAGLSKADPLANESLTLGQKHSILRAEEIRGIADAYTERSVIVDWTLGNSVRLLYPELAGVVLPGELFAPAGAGYAAICPRSDTEAESYTIQKKFGNYGGTYRSAYVCVGRTERPAVYAPALDCEPYPNVDEFELTRIPVRPPTEYREVCTGTEKIDPETRLVPNCERDDGLLYAAVEKPVTTGTVASSTQWYCKAVAVPAAWGPTGEVGCPVVAGVQYRPAGESLEDLADGSGTCVAPGEEDAIVGTNYSCQEEPLATVQLSNDMCTYSRVAMQDTECPADYVDRVLYVGFSRVEVCEHTKVATETTEYSCTSPYVLSGTQCKHETSQTSTDDLLVPDGLFGADDVCRRRSGHDVCAHEGGG